MRQQHGITDQLSIAIAFLIVIGSPVDLAIMADLFGINPFHSAASTVRLTWRAMQIAAEQ